MTHETKPGSHAPATHAQVVDAAIKPWKEGEGQRFLEESSFAILFPKYREKYLQQVWPNLSHRLSSYGIGADLNPVEGTMTVRTTVKTRDPFIILKARDMIRLLSRSVPFPKAVEVLGDDVACDVIKISGIVRNQERFIKRRSRILGPDGNTLKALELLTKCYVMVRGCTVCAIGPFRGLRDVRRIVLGCMKNQHPIHSIRELMIKRELQKDPKLKDQEWDRFLPHFEKMRKGKPTGEGGASTVSCPRKKQKLGKKRKLQLEARERNPFPPPQQARKIDLMLESGEYFEAKDEVVRRQTNERKVKEKARREERAAIRRKRYEAPDESSPPGGDEATAVVKPPSTRSPNKRKRLTQDHSVR